MEDLANDAADIGQQLIQIEGLRGDGGNLEQEIEQIAALLEARLASTADASRQGPILNPGLIGQWRPLEFEHLR